MDVLTVHGIDDNGFDDSSLDLDLKCSLKATLEAIRDLISENMYASENLQFLHNPTTNFDETLHA